MKKHSPEQTERKITQWAANEPAIRAVIEVGSQARTDHPADEFSDLDLLVLIIPPIEPAQMRRWLQEISHIIGNVWSIVQETNPGSDWFPLGNFISGTLKVDLVGSILSETFITVHSLEDILTNIPYSYIFYPSCKVLYDQCGIPREIPFAEGKYAPQIPEETELLNAYRHFWMELIHIAQTYNRGERYRAMVLQSQCFEKSLLNQIVWHSILFQNSEKVWPRGRFLEEWADPRIVSDLKFLKITMIENIFWDSIFQLFDVYQWVALEICTKKGFSFPDDEASAYRNWLKDLSLNRSS